jgi:hypothetical protein
VEEILGVSDCPGANGRRQIIVPRLVTDASNEDAHLDVPLDALSNGEVKAPAKKKSKSTTRRK